MPRIAAADKGQNGGSYLLGGENKTMMELVKEISALIGKPAPDGRLVSRLQRQAPARGLNEEISVVEDEALRRRTGVPGKVCVLTS